MIEGIKINLGGTEYIVPPLNFKSLKRLQPIIESLSQIDITMTDKQIDDIAEIVHAAISRNYPDFTKEQILDVLDLGNIGPILASILGASGVKKVLLGEREADKNL